MLYLSSVVLARFYERTTVRPFWGHLAELGGLQKKCTGLANVVMLEKVSSIGNNLIRVTLSKVREEERYGGFLK